MVTAILPLYPVIGLQFSPAAYGVIDGVYTGATVLLRLVGGYVADPMRRRKAGAVTGYGLSALAKLGLLAAAGSATAIGAAIAVDRAVARPALSARSWRRNARAKRRMA